METAAYKWHYFFNKNKAVERAIDDVKENYSKLGVEVNLKTRRMLSSLVNKNNHELMESLERFNANGIMLINISLGLFLFALISIADIAINGFAPFTLLILGLALLFSYVVVRAGALYFFWYWRGTLEQAIHYVKDAPELLGKPKKKNARTT
jgi:hypothetical protein